MTDLLILSRQPDALPRAQGYRGTFRGIPTFPDVVRENHPAHSAFKWFLKEGGEAGVVHDLERARELVRLYRDAGVNDEFEILEAVRSTLQPTTGESFLGFDVSSALHDSVLWWGLDIWSPKGAASIIDPFVRLVETYFRPRLNQHVLFANHEDAQWCCECFIAFETLAPGFFEIHDKHPLEVVELYMVPDD